MKSIKGLDSAIKNFKKGIVSKPISPKFVKYNMTEIIATCGHKLTEKEGFGKNIIIEDWDRENKKCEASIVVCNKCYKDYKKRDWILREVKQ